MAKLTPSERASLRDSAFAYIDSSGRRRLPIHDEAHVRNALARFDRVAFEDEAAQERARKRLLNAAKKYGIVPVGFMTGQLSKVKVKSAGFAGFPTGAVTLLLTDIEGSTAILEHLGGRYGAVLSAVRGIHRRAVTAADGFEVDTRADEYFAVFKNAASALVAAVAIQRGLGERAWPDDLECRVRIGIHSGRPSLTELGYVGLAVHTASRVCDSGHGGQILVSAEARRAMKGSVPARVRLRSLGEHRLRGLTRPQRLFQAEAEGLTLTFPALRQ